MKRQQKKQYIHLPCHHFVLVIVLKDVKSYTEGVLMNLLCIGDCTRKNDYVREGKRLGEAVLKLEKMKLFV